MLKEFRDFINKGNVLDLAVAFVMGASFNPIVKSLVDHIIMPPIGLLMGNMDFSELKIVLRAAILDNEAVVAPEVAIQYGTFINTIISFVITAFAMFLIIKAYNKTKKKEEPKATTTPPPPSAEVQLLGEIRDLLKK